MDNRYEEEYRLYWKVCLNAVGPPAGKAQVFADPEYLKRKMAKDPSASSDPFWLFEKMKEPRTYQRATDQNDLFKLKGDDEIVPMHPMSWKWTIDAVLAEYMYLANSSKRNQPIQLPLEILDAHEAYCRDDIAERKKLRIPIDQLKMIGRGKNATTCLLPRYTGIAQLNLLCHDLCMDRRATKKKTEIFYDGVRYVAGKENPGSDDLLQPEFKAIKEQNPDHPFPSFTLSDYIFHELATGISLSIEITAALMELNKAIRDAALEAFFEKGLAEVTRSAYIYTRISIARRFFHQIRLEWDNNTTIAKHVFESPTEKGTGLWEFPKIGVDFEDALDFARHDLELLNWSCMSIRLEGRTYYSKPAEQIHIEGESCSVVYKTDKEREDRDEALAPWIEPRDEKGTDLWLHTHPYSVWRGSAPKDDAELEALLRYYEGLLEMVEYPLNFAKWKEESPLNLALFVQMEHKYVKVILDWLRTGDIRKGSLKEDYKERNETVDIFKDPGSICIKYFQKIHSRVQEACAATIEIKK